MTPKETAEAILRDLPDHDESVDITWPHDDPALMCGEFLAVSDLKELAKAYLGASVEIEGVKYPAVAVEGLAPGDRLLKCTENSCAVFAPDGAFKGVLPVSPRDAVHIRLKKPVATKT
jgi:hypothetical protein